MLNIRKSSLASLFLFAVTSVPVQAVEFTGYVSTMYNDTGGTLGQYTYTLVGLSPTCSGGPTLYASVLDPVIVGILQNARMNHVPVQLTHGWPLQDVMIREPAALEVAGKCL